MKYIDFCRLSTCRLACMLGVFCVILSIVVQAKADPSQDVLVSVLTFEPGANNLSTEHATEQQDALTNTYDAFTMFADRPDVNLVIKVSASLDGVDGQKLVDARLDWLLEHLSSASAQDGGMIIEHDGSVGQDEAILSLRPESSPSNLCPWWMTVKTHSGPNAVEVTLPAGYSGVLPMAPKATVTFKPAFDPPHHLVARVNETTAVDATGRAVTAPAVMRLAVAVQPIDPMSIREAGEEDARNIALSQKVALDAPLVCTVKLIERGLGEAVVRGQ